MFDPESDTFALPFIAKVRRRKGAGDEGPPGLPPMGVDRVRMLKAALLSTAPFAAVGRPCAAEAEAGPGRTNSLILFSADPLTPHLWKNPHFLS